jgi:hypothetical protein
MARGYRALDERGSRTPNAVLIARNRISYGRMATITLG